MEICCVWVAIHEPIRLHVGDAAYLELDDMFASGNLFIKLDSADLVSTRACSIPTRLSARELPPPNCNQQLMYTVLVTKKISPGINKITYSNYYIFLSPKPCTSLHPPSRSSGTGYKSPSALPYKQTGYGSPSTTETQNSV